MPRRQRPLSTGKLVHPDDAQFAPCGIRASRFNAGCDELVVFSFPVKSPEVPSGLSPGEREVLLALLEGLSNAEIAERRGTSARTVANQVASIFRKLGVSSRVELSAIVLRSGADGDGEAE